MLTINELLYNRGLPKGAKIKFVRHRRASYAVHMSILLPKKFFSSGLPLLWRGNEGEALFYPIHLY